MKQVEAAGGDFIQKFALGTSSAKLSQLLWPSWWLMASSETRLFLPNVPKSFLFLFVLSGTQEMSKAHIAALGIFWKTTENRSR